MVLAVGFMLIVLIVSLLVLRFYSGQSITSNYSYQFLKWIEQEASKEILVKANKQEIDKK